MKHRDVDRRTFLAAASGAGLAPWLMSCEYLDTPQPKSAANNGVQIIPPSEQITLGFIGLGIRGGSVMNRYFLRNPAVRVLGVCDVDRTRREHFKGVVDKRYGSTDCIAYVDYRKLLEREDIDAVVIATPDHWHATQCIHAAAAGKDIYCEKPLTHTLAEGKLLIDAVQRHGRVFQTGSQQRTEFGHKFVRAVEYIRSGRLGDLLSVHVGVGNPPKPCDLGSEKMEPGLDWDRWLGPAPMRPYNSELSPRGIIKHYPRWRHFTEYAGGGLADMGAHHFDIVQWALDADTSGPIEVLPPAVKTKMRGARLRYDSGLVVTHGGPGGATFIGTQGMIQVDRNRITSFPDKILKEALAESDFHIPRPKDHGTDWLECIKSRQPATCTAEIGARSAAVCQLANLAYHHDTSFRWDPVAWKFADDTDPALLDYDRRAAYRV
ncbi:MAG: Gfo/Idh/MocA family oxidoreductase [Planctomycetota bacterium]|nr:Gfo/Idh/MocA family oxidoreductase [Planctomycetota bacterium]